MVTIKDVAKKSGFSPSTVSLVLNDAPLARYIPEKTKKQIRQAVEALGYRPNVFARGLRSNRSHTVGVIVFDITDPYCTQILQGIENALHGSGYLPILTDIQNKSVRFKQVVEMLLDRRVDGLITIANSLSLQVDFLAALEKLETPVVIIGRKLEQDSFSSVVVNNEAGARLGMEHLVGLGHRRIAFIKGPKVIVDSKQRWKGIRAAARKLGLELDPKLVVDLKRPVLCYEDGYKLTKRLLKDQRSFTAIFAFDDMTAWGVIRALNEEGLKVPEDCSVVGFDDLPTSAFCTPPLTTIRQPMDSLGSIGVEILLDGITALLNKSKLSPQLQQVEPELVVRDSTARVKE